MGLLCWERPDKQWAAQEEYEEANSSSAEAAGTYVPNMSDEDNAKWKAKLVGQKTGPLRVEIRRYLGEAQVVVVVSEETQGALGYWFRESLKYDPNRKPRMVNVSLSANGKVAISFEDWAELQIVIAEARAYLKEYASAEATEARRNAAQEKRTAKELAEYQRLQRRLSKRGVLAAGGHHA